MRLIQSNISIDLQIGVRSGIAALMILLFFNSTDKILHRLKDKKIFLLSLAVGLFFPLSFFLLQPLFCERKHLMYHYFCIQHLFLQPLDCILLFPTKD